MTDAGQGIIGFGDQASRMTSARVLGAFATRAELKAFPLARRSHGALALVESDASLWVLDSASAAEDDAEQQRALACDAGGGAYSRVGYGTQVQSYVRVFDHADPDVALEDTTAAIDLGAVLPVGAIVLAVVADNTEAWTDGDAGTFSMDVGVSAGDDDLFTPTALDIDGGIALLNANHAPVPASGTQLAVTITGSVDLDTATAGTTQVTVLFTVPIVTTILAPEPEPE